MPSKKINTPIEPGCTYHIFNRGNNFQNVFFQQEDYHLFLDKLKFHLNNCCSIYAFALLPNHYHLLLRVNDNLNQLDFSHQFTKFMLSYTNKINFRDKRNGALFLSHFRRIKIEDEDYLKRLVFYINYNPVKHRITDDFKSYKYCSYPICLSDQPTSLARSEVLNIFGGLEDFIQYHSYLHDFETIKRNTFEDED